MSDLALWADILMDEDTTVTITDDRIYFYLNTGKTTYYTSYDQSGINYVD
jgi:hypothetical protein